MAKGRGAQSPDGWDDGRRGVGDGEDGDERRDSHQTLTQPGRRALLFSVVLYRSVRCVVALARRIGTVPVVSCLPPVACRCVF